jgi:dihydrofolate synthase/folylpolyglutamate synthase
MNFREAEAYLTGTINETLSIRMPYRLDRMRALVRELGNPQDAYPTVHVAGTSGKGSTSTMIAAMLQASGKRVGLHTKPHLRSVRERARIDGVPVSEERFAALLAEMLPAIDRVAVEHGRATYYETLLALAFVHFARERVDAAVIEVGIGGKLDGTNVITPVVGAITTIGWDHMDVLGDTLEAIAADKAGIAKPGVPLVSSVADAGPRAVIEARCREVGAPFVSVLDTTTIEAFGLDGSVQRCRIATPEAAYDVRLSVLGAFQRANAATAIRVAENLPVALRPSRDAIERGLAATRLTGRMEVVGEHPAVVFDVAHNAEKAAHFARALRERFGTRAMHIVVAIGQSKDAKEILRAFAALQPTFTFTTFHADGRGATDPRELLRLAQELGVGGSVKPDPIDAFRAACAAAGDDGVVAVTGSTFVVAEVRECRAS